MIIFFLIIVCILVDMKSILTSLFVILALSGFSQITDTSTVNPESDTLPKNWKLHSTFGLNGTQTSFINWSAGGRNNISALGSIVAGAEYTKDKVKWSNDFIFALGGLKYLEKDSEEGLQKTDDRIELSTNIGYELRENLYLSLLGGFRTQMLDGFAYPNDSIRVSTFLAPAYVNLALGLEYTKNDGFSVFVSPLAMKLTIVNDAVLANSGAFGVDPAIYDSLGNVLTEGKRSRAEFGAYARIQFNKTLAKNIDLRSKIELFSNYLEKPQNIDVNAEVMFDFKINSWLTTSLQWMLIYDDDIRITDANGNTGPRTQFKSVFGLGLSVKMKNYKDS